MTVEVVASCLFSFLRHSDESRNLDTNNKITDAAEMPSPASAETQRGDLRQLILVRS